MTEKANTSKRSPPNRSLGPGGQVDEKALAAAIDALENAAVQRFARCGLAAARSGKDPKAAAEVIDNLDANWECEASISFIIENWAKADPQAALQWIQQHRDARQEYADYQAGVVMKVWAGKSPEETLRQLNKEKAPSLAVYAAIAEGFAGSDPEKALVWSKSLDNPKQRFHALLGVARGACPSMKD